MASAQSVDDASHILRLINAALPNILDFQIGIDRIQFSVYNGYNCNLSTVADGDGGAKFGAEITSITFYFGMANQMISGGLFLL